MGVLGHPGGCGCFRLPAAVAYGSISQKFKMRAIVSYRAVLGRSLKIAFKRGK
jgi:hypothetical protein